MSKADSRNRTLSLLMKSDREKAQRALAEARQESEKIASDLDAIRNAISLMKTRMEQTGLTGPTFAAKLAREMEGERLTKRALEKRRKMAQDLEETAKKAEERVDRAKDAVAKAQKALSILDKDDDKKKGTS